MRDKPLTLDDARLAIDEVNATVTAQQETMRLANRLAIKSYADMVRFIVSQVGVDDTKAIARYAENNLVSWSGFEK